MRRRPSEFAIVGWTLLGVAASFPLQTALTFGHPPWELSAILTRLAPLNWVVAGLSVFCAGLSFRAAPALKFAAPLLLGATVWNQWVVAGTGLNASPYAALLGALGMAAVLGLLLRQDPRAVLQRPGLRWWRTAPRRRARLRVSVWPVLGGELAGETVDLSEGGAFISWEGVTALPRGEEVSRNLRVGAHCSVRIVIDSQRTLRCSAQVVRQASAGGKYPEGIALRFIGLTAAERRMLADFVRSGPREEAKTESEPVAGRDSERKAG
jgi:hypothetical protein